MPEDYVPTPEDIRRLIQETGGLNLAGQGGGGILSQLRNQAQQTDPTYSSGFDYARTIAGGMPFEDVVAPGMSFSPDQPMGYTQADLRKKEIYGDFDGVMPVAPTKGAPLEASYETMPYAPVGTPMPTPFIPGQTAFPGIPDFLKDLDFRSLPGAESKQDFFKADKNLFNFEEIADKIDMDEVAKIDIEKINIPESVSLFSDILKEPKLPSVFEPMVQPITSPKVPVQTLPQSIFANIPTPQPLPMPVIPSVEEIVSPIRIGRTLPQTPRGLFSL